MGGRLYSEWKGSLFWLSCSEVGQGNRGICSMILLYDFVMFL